jgi:DNA-binding MarR family transcriptional regulator
MPKDSADLHVERWRDHWALEVPFDDETEAAMVRIQRLDRYLTRTTKQALVETGLQDFEYETLHHLMIRDTPGRASPTALARALGVSPAGMTGRLDGLEKRGFLKRVPGTEDRRKVDVEITRDGMKTWRTAMGMRGAAEEDLAKALTAKELVSLNRLLRKLLLQAEGDTDAG